MENKKNVEVSKVSKMKLNINFIDFVDKVMKEKLLSKNREELGKLYIDSVKVKSFRNVLRVSDRCKREKLRVVLMNVLKEKGIDYIKFNKVSNDIVSKLKDRKVSNYIEV